MANLLERYASGGSSQGQRSPGGPGAPEGLQQRGGVNLLDPQIQQERGFGAYYRMPRWETGGQFGSTANAYNTDFNNAWFKQQEESARKGENAYERKDYTGIVLRDEVTKGKKFGDVYEDGKLVHNLYDKYGAEQANQILMPMLSDSKAQSRAYREALNDPEAISREVERQRERANKDAKGFLTQQKYMGRVEEKQREHKEGLWDEGMTLGGALGGVAAGASLGAAIGLVPGAIIGGALGGLIGGIGAWLNQDQLTTVTASTAVQMEMARERGNEWQANSLFLSGAGQVAVSMISPFQNLTQGAYDWDWGRGTVGDGRARYYEHDENGERIAPLWVRGLNLAATFADFGLMQHNLVSSGIYMGSMGATAGGEALALATSGGLKWDDATGDFKQLDSFGQYVAAGGEVAIDVAQIALFHGIGRNITKLRNRSTPDGLRNTTVALGGYKFQTGADGLLARDAAGNLVKGAAKKTWTAFLVPSDAVLAGSVRVNAMRLAAKDGRAVSADDLYRAATSLTTGSRKITGMIMNGFGEGTEEGVQEVLNALALEHDQDLMDIATAATVGFASGFGMTFGANMRRTKEFTSPRMQKLMASDAGAKFVNWISPQGSTPSKAMFARYQLGQILAQDTENPHLQYTEDQFADLPYQHQVSLSQLSNPVAQMLQDANAELQSQQTLTSNVNLPNIDLMSDFSRLQLEQAEGKIKANPEASMVIVQKDSTLTKSIDAEVSLPQMIRLYQAALEGFQGQEADLVKSGEDTSFVVEVQKQLGELINVLTNAGSQIEAMLQQLNDPGNVSISQQDYLQAVSALNQTIKDMWHGRKLAGDTDITPFQLAARRRAVTAMLTRDPQQKAASFFPARLQINASLTTDNANNVAMISHAILEGIGGDFDGDTMRSQARALLSEEAFRNFRAGAQLLDSEGLPMLPVRQYEQAQFRMLQYALVNTDVNSPTYIQAEAMLDATTKALLQELSPYFRDDQKPALIEAIRKFDTYATEFKEASPNALLRNALATSFGDQLLEEGAKDYRNLFLLIDDIVMNKLQNFQTTMQGLIGQAIAAASKAKASGQQVSEDDLKKFSPSIAQYLENTGVKVENIRIPGVAEVDSFSVYATNKLAEALLNLHTSDIYRAPQAIHNGIVHARTAEASKISEETQGEWFQQISQFYSALRGKSQQHVDALGIADKPMLSTIKHLEDYAKEIGANSLAQLAVSTQPVFFQGEFLGFGNLAQQLFAMEVTELLEDINNPDELMQQRIKRWKSWMHPENSARGTIEILGAMQVSKLDTVGMPIVAPGISLKQFVDQLADSNPESRAEALRFYKELSFYTQGKTDVKSAAAEEVAKRSLTEGSIVTDYQALLDLVAEVANNLRPYDESTGLVGGFTGDKEGGTSYAVSRDIQKVIGDVRSNMLQQNQDITFENVRNYLNENKGFANSLVDALGIEARIVSLNNEKNVAPFLVEMFLQDSVAKGEMVFFRHKLLKQWQGLAKLKPGIDLDGIHDPWMQLLWYVRNQPEEHFAKPFEEMLLISDSVHDFVGWVNKEIASQTGRVLTAWTSDNTTSAQDDLSAVVAQDTGVSTAEAVSILALRSKEVRDKIEDITDNFPDDQKLAKKLSTELAEIFTNSGLKLDSSSDMQVALKYLDENKRVITERLRKTIVLAGMVAGQQTAPGPKLTADLVHAMQVAVHGSMHGKAEASKEAQAYGDVQINAVGSGFNIQMDRNLDQGLSIDVLDALENPKALWGKTVSLTNSQGQVLQEVTFNLPTILDMAQDPQTWGFAKAMLLPTALESDDLGNTSLQFVGPATLDEAVERDSKHSIEQILEHAWGDRASEAMALIDAETIKFSTSDDIEMPFLSAFTDLAIVRAGKAKRSATDQQLISDANQLKKDVMKLAYKSASILAATPGDTSAIEQNLVALQQEQARRRFKRIFSVEATSYEYAESVIDFILGVQLDDIEQRRIALTDELTELKSTSDRARIERVKEVLDQLDTEEERTTNRTKSLIDGTLMQQVMLTFAFKDVPKNASAKTRAEIENHNTEARMNIKKWLSNPRNTSKLINRDSTARNILSGALGSDGQQIRPEAFDLLSKKQWNELSNTIGSLKVEELAGVGQVPGQVIRMDPPGTPAHARIESNYDSILHAFISPTSPIVQAYASLLKRYNATLADGASTEKSAIDELNDLATPILKDLEYWDPLVQAMITNKNNQFASAAAPQSSAMNGDIPKKAIASAVANRSTWEDIPDEAFTVVSVSGEQMLRASKPTAITFQQGATASQVQTAADTNFVHGIELKVADEQGNYTTSAKRTMAIEMLNGRWARNATAFYDGVAIEVADGGTNLFNLIDFNAAFKPTTGEGKSAKELQVVHSNRLFAAALTAYLKMHKPDVLNDLDVFTATVGQLEDVGIDVDKFSFSVEMVHPDSLPLTAKFINNGYAQGDVFANPGDMAIGPIARLYTYLDDIGIQLGISSTKGKNAAIYLGKLVDGLKLSQYLEAGETDLAHAIEQMAQEILRQNYGDGFKLPASAINGIIAILKQRIMIRGFVNGKPKAMSAQEAINKQLRGQDLGFDEGKWEFLRISPRALRTMLGDSGKYRLEDVQLDELITSPQDFKTFDPTSEGVAEMISRVPNLLEVREEGRFYTPTLQEMLPQLQKISRVNPYTRGTRLTTQNKNKAREDSYSQHQHGVNDRRSTKGVQSIIDNFSQDNMQEVKPGNNSAAMINRVSSGAYNANVALSDNADDLKHSDLPFKRIGPHTSWGNYRAVWRLAPDKTRDSDPRRGIVTPGNLQLANEKGLNVTYRDLVVIPLREFEEAYSQQAPAKAFQELGKALQKLSSLGAYIYLDTSGTGLDLATEASDFLVMEEGYGREQGNPYMLSPRFDDLDSLNIRSLSLAQGRARSLDSKNSLVIALSDTAAIYEQGAILFTDRPSKGMKSLSAIPANYMAGFAPPTGQAAVTAVQAKVRDLYDNNMDFLYELSDIKPTSEEAQKLRQKMEKLLFHWDELGPSMVYKEFHELLAPKLEVGDIIPLYNSKTGQLVLHRYGHTPADPGHQFMQNIVGHTRSAEVAIASPKPKANETFLEGYIEKASEGSNRKLNVRITTPLASWYNKIHLLEENLKLIPVRSSESLGDSFKGDIFKGLGIDLLAHVDDAAGKGTESINGYETALMQLGGHLYRPIYNTFTGKNWDSLSKSDQEQARADILSFLKDFKTRGMFVDTGVGQKLFAEGEFRTLLLAYGEKGFMADPRTANEDALVKLLEDDSPATTTEKYLTLMALAYLTMPNTKVSNTVEWAGIADETNYREGLISVGPDMLFAHVLDQSPSQVRTYLNTNVVDVGVLGDGVVMGNDFTFAKTIEDGSGNPFTEIFQLGVVKYVYKGDGAEAKEQSYFSGQRRGTTNYSAHNANLQAMAAGIHQARPELSDKYDRTIKALLGPQADIGPSNFWNIMRTHEKTKLVPKHIRTPKAREYMRQAREKRLLLSREIFFHDDTSKEDVTRFEQEKTLVGNLLGLNSAQHVFIDYWIRRWLFREAPQEGHDGAIPIGEAFSALQAIKTNVLNGKMPTDGGGVPQVSLLELDVLFTQNKGENAKWKLLDGNLQPVVSWDGWVSEALNGHANDILDPFGLKAYDGLRHTFLGQRAAPLLPISDDILVEARLLDEDRQVEIVSVNGRIQELLLDNLAIESTPVAVSSIVDRTLADPERAVARTRFGRRREMNRRRKAYHQADAVQMTQADMEKHGPQYVSNKAHQAAIVDIFVKFRVINALANPALFVSSYGEAFYRKMLNAGTNFAAGTSLGRGAAAQAWMYEKLPEAFQNALTRAFGDPKLAAESLETIRVSITSLATSHELQETLWREGNYQSTQDGSMGRFRRGLTSLTNVVAKWQDPIYGMDPQKIAQMYMETVIAAVVADPYSFKETPVQMAQALAANGKYVAEKYPSLHQEAVAAFKNLRSIKPTVFSLALSTTLQSMMSSPSFARQVTGMMLWAPLAFANFGTNVAVTMTGMQGPTQLLTLALHGRKKPKVLMALQRFLAGDTMADGSTDTVSETFDLTPAIESLDLSRAFIQSGVSLTALFMGAMITGTLGLTGEDDEEKRRRRRARITNNQYIYDPRDIANDFRNADAIFLENVPFLGPLFATVLGSDEAGYRSMANPHWMVKQFLSPILGIEMFMETGDFRQVIWGFEDGLASFPLINSMMYGETQRMVAELTAQMKDQDALGNEDSLAQTFNTLSLIVMTYENMLFENSFLNQVYAGMDALDRDPYIQVLIEKGEIFLDKDGQPMQTNAIDEFVNDDGEIQGAYKKREGAELGTHILAENRLGIAFAASLLTGQAPWDSSYWRYNMAPKVRKISLEEIDQEIAEGLLLSMFDASGTEVLTESGARAVFNGLYAGTVNLNDASLSNIYIPKEMRSAIREKWIDELIVEGMEKYDLTEWDARGRAWDIMKGTPETNGVGLDSFIWSDAIPTKKTAEYTQLNTTYVPGPGGQFYATGVERGNLLNIVGINPLQAYKTTAGPGQGIDDRLNTTDDVFNLNTGMRSLLRRDESTDNLTEEEIAESLAKAFEESLKENIGDLIDEINKGGRDGKGWGGYYSRGGYGRSGRGGGGGGGGGGVGRINAPPRNITPYSGDARSPNVSNPNIRRSFIKRERFTSQRGRLKQWQ